MQVLCTEMGQAVREAVKRKFCFEFIKFKKSIRHSRGMNV